MICKKCKTEVSEEVKYCPECGAKLKNKEKNQNSKKSKILIIFLVAIILALILVIVYMHFNNTSKSNEEKTVTENETTDNVKRGIYNKILNEDELYTMAEGDCYLEIRGNTIMIGNNFACLYQTGTFEVKDNKLIGSYTEIIYLDHTKGGEYTTKEIDEKLEFTILEDGLLKDELGYGYTLWDATTKGELYKFYGENYVLEYESIIGGLTVKNKTDNAFDFDLYVTNSTDYSMGNISGTANFISENYAEYEEANCKIIFKINENNISLETEGDFSQYCYGDITFDGTYKITDSF